MDPQQYNYYSESIMLCNKLINQLENDRDSAQLCFKGEMLTAYRKSTDKALQQIRRVRTLLQSVQAAQQ